MAPVGKRYGVYREVKATITEALSIGLHRRHAVTASTSAPKKTVTKSFQKHGGRTPTAIEMCVILNG